MEMKAVFARKENNFEPKDCVIEKVITLSAVKYDEFTRNMLRNRDFIRDNKQSMFHDGENKLHGLLVIGDGRRDGVFIDSSGADYARYAAFIPNAADIVTALRYPSLTAMTQKLEKAVDHVVDNARNRAADNLSGNRVYVDLDDLGSKFGLDIPWSVGITNIFTDMLAERAEVLEMDYDGENLRISVEPLEVTREQKKEQTDLSDPTTTIADMHEYGYHYDGMIPFGKERALELFDAGNEVYMLYEDNTEGAAFERADIEKFKGIFGVEKRSEPGQPESEPVHDEHTSVHEKIVAARSAPSAPRKAKSENKEDIGR